MRVRSLEPDDREWVGQFIVGQWGSGRIVSRGCIHNAADLEGFVAFVEAKPVGLITYRHAQDELEIVSLNSLVERVGIGSALIHAADRVAKAAHCRRIWLITTNDNLAALRFYQKRGFHLVAVYRDSLAESRRLKPEIPLLGLDGIPLRDEVELERIIEAGSGRELRAI